MRVTQQQPGQTSTTALTKRLPGTRIPRRWKLAGLVVLALLATVAMVVVLRLALAPAAPQPEPALPELTGGQIVDTLVRYGAMPGFDGPDLDVLLATPTYFAFSGRTVPESAGAQASVVFYVSEGIHIGELPALPRPLLRTDGGPLVAPVHSEEIADSEHHRTSLHVYAAEDLGPVIDAPGVLRRLELVFPAADRSEPWSNVLSWDLPLSYESGLSEDYVTVGGPARPAAAPAFEPAAALGWGALLAIMAGMLVALTPCLIQLGVYYAAALAGVGAEGGSQASVLELRRHIMRTGLFFALGFTLVYTAGGAAAGIVGQSLQTLGFFNQWAQPLSIAAGAIILLMALRVAWNARAPVVCKLPLGKVMGRPRRTGVLGSALMGFTFAGGCLSCFAATVLPALLIYAGATGSVAAGAGLLFVFSLGVSIPCLVIALGVARVEPLLLRLQRAGPVLGLASAGVMAAFGIIMITYQFHIVSGLIYSWLGLA